MISSTIRIGLDGATFSGRHNGVQGLLRGILFYTYTDTLSLPSLITAWLVFKLLSVPMLSNMFTPH